LGYNAVSEIFLAEYQGGQIKAVPYVHNDEKEVVVEK